MSAVSSHVHAPPLSAAEALSTLLWQPYECRSPPFVRARPDGAAAASARAPPARAPSVLPPALASRSRSPQSPSGGRDARACSYAFAISSRPEMRLPVPAPATARECDSVSVRVPGEPSRANVSSVHIVPAADAAVNVSSAVQTERERTVVSAHCQTEEPRRRRARRARLSRCAPLSPPPPDLLEGNVPPPPYSTLPLHAPPPPHPPPPLLAASPLPPPSMIPAPPPHHPLPPPPPQHRFPFQPVPLRRSGRGAAYACSEGSGGAPKSCCGRPPLRLCVLLLGVVGACLVAAGAVLGALRPHPKAPLTLLMLMIGIGVVLVTAAGLAWRLGARGGPCALLGLRRASCRRLVPRLPPSYARPHHPYAAMLYPEFHYRPPPPSYQASMHEYRLRLLLLDRSAPAVSPPPTYRSNSASLVRGASVAGWCGSEYSGPPSYRAPRVEPTATPVDVLPVTPIELKYGEELAPQLAAGADREKDPHHLVTIVQTDAQPVIVTVSGSPALALTANDTSQPSSEIDILAHL